MEQFSIIVPVRNSEQYIAECLRSVLSQTFEAWSLVVIDDASQDCTAAVAREVAADDPRVVVVKNSTRQYGLKNCIDAIHKYSPHNSIVAILDGDDKLSGPGVLEDLARYYEESGADAVWTQHINSDGSPNISRPMSGDPVDCGWTMSHMKTFRKSLVWGAHESHDAVLAEDGPWQRCGYDQALYRPILACAKSPKFFRRACYWYRIRPSSNRTTEQRQAQAGIIERCKRYRTRPRRVALIVPGADGADPRFATKEVRHPIGVATLAARLNAYGHTATIVDRWAEPEAWEGVTQAHIVGMYSTLPFWADASAVLKRLAYYHRGRMNRRKYLMAGGPAMMARPGYGQPWVDLVCRGEADNAILSYVRESINGIERPERVKDLDAIPFPAYENMAGDYVLNWPYDRTRPVVALSSSRGCPYDCSFCTTRDILGRQWFGQSPERMVLDVREAQRLGYGAIYYREDNFGCSRTRIERFCDLVQLTGMKWACEMRADRACISALAERMAAAGCVGWYIGAESGSERMLKVFNKRITRKQIDQSVTNAKRNKITAALSFIDNHPEETEQDKAETHALARQADIAWRCEFRPRVPVVLALFAAHNEDVLIESTLSHLAAQMPVVALLDTPTPHVLEVCDRLAQKVIVWNEDAAGADHVYRHRGLLKELNRLANSNELPASEWILRVDADEYWSEVENVANVAESVGCNVVNFPIRQFAPLHNEAPPASDPRELVRPANPGDGLYLAPNGNIYERLWKRGTPVIIDKGGHGITRKDRKVYKASTTFDHVPAIDHKSLIEKAERAVPEDELKVGWHIQYRGVSKKNMAEGPIRIFYHVGQIGVWRGIVEEQIKLLEDYGLLDAAASLDVVHVGSKERPPVPEFARVSYGGDIKRYEFPTLEQMFNHCKMNQTDVCLYFHTKGAFNTRPHVKQWRDYLNWAVLENWKRCVESIRMGYDMAGVEWVEGSRLRRWGCDPAPGGFWAGNFWWGSARYIRNLRDPSTLNQKNRWYAEAWPGYGRPDIQNFFDTRQATGGKFGWENKSWGRKDYA